MGSKKYAPAAAFYGRFGRRVGAFLDSVENLYFGDLAPVLRSIF